MGDEAGDDSGSIKVCVRVRCFIREELEGSRSGGQTELCISMPTKTTVIMFGNGQERNFEYDRCYWSFSKDHPLYADQQTLQSELGMGMIRNGMNGYNNCIFAYGQTGSGKSFSVLGGKGEARGLLPRVCEALFVEIAGFPKDITAKTLVSFVEIYNEGVFDLLAQRKPGEQAQALQVKAHPTLGTVIPNLTEAAVADAEAVLGLVDYGTNMRHVSATAMNATSSRSHCIFTFKLNIVDAKGAKMSSTNLVDLAGSERAGRTAAQGDRLKEGAAINQSLSTLARVISELAKGKKAKNPPFRDSKLTYILKESLSGNSKTVMMAAISPNLLDFDETLSTMKFAQSVKLVQTSAVANLKTSGTQEIAADLQAEMDAMRAQLLAAEKDQSASVQMKEELQQQLDMQEYLVKIGQGFFGDDWEQMLAAEKRRQVHRRALLSSQLDEHFFSQMQHLADQVQLDASDSSDDGRGSRSLTDDSRYSSEESDDEEQCVLMQWGDGGEEKKNRIHSQARTTMVLVGSGAQELSTKWGPEAIRKKSSKISSRFTNLKENVELAMTYIRELSVSPELEVHLKRMVMLDPDDLTITLGVAVTYKHHQNPDEEEEDSDSDLEDDEDRRPEDRQGSVVVPEDDFNRRLSWLSQECLHRRNANASSGDQKNNRPSARGAAGGGGDLYEDPWLEAGLASCGAEQAEAANLEYLESAEAEVLAAREAARVRRREQVKRCMEAASELAEHTALSNRKAKADKKTNQRVSVSTTSENSAAQDGNKAPSPKKGCLMPSVTMDLLMSFDNALAALDSAQLAIKAKPYAKPAESENDNN
eukprot:TRINITY_DN21193_c0_g1_i1.p1 TRINITY_DN21193_c0_g1~~TRINITY_DN21193_c0_g1_i1.p1  ORF type:complete len:817 (-),score=232.89 TRINITY_DN21193_c0_g1_i1:98-2548(-)